MGIKEHFNKATGKIGEGVRKAEMDVMQTKLSMAEMSKMASEIFTDMGEIAQITDDQKHKRPVDLKKARKIIDNLVEFNDLLHENPSLSHKVGMVARVVKSSTKGAKKQLEELEVHAKTYGYKCDDCGFTTTDEQEYTNHNHNTPQPVNADNTKNDNKGE